MTETYEHPFFLAYDTPAGPRFAYPVPKVSSHPLSIVGEPAWLEGVRRGNYIITTREVGVLTYVWTERGPLSDWGRRPEPSGSGLARQLWIAAPPHPTEEVRAILADDDDNEFLVWASVYGRQRESAEVHTKAYDVSGAVAMPGKPDPAPERTWTPTELARVEVYGRGAAHLFPGYLEGFYSAVAHAIEAEAARLSIPGFKIYTHTRSMISVFYDVQWDIAVPLPSKSRPRGAPATARKHSTQHVERRVSDVLPGETKQAALDAFDAAVAEEVAKFIPLEGAVRACSACRGRGFHLPS